MSTRYLTEIIDELAMGRHKIVFLSGPRQVGKTSLAKGLLAARGTGRYFNWDSTEFKKLWGKNPSSIVDGLNRLPVPLVILDEIHKASRWKTVLKGVYDTLSSPIDFVVTGSARLDTFKRGSDSLLGRYLPFRLHPFSMRELLFNSAPPEPSELLNLISTGASEPDGAQGVLGQLLKFGGFPEPFTAKDEAFHTAWRTTRLEAIVREDLRDLSRLQELDQVQFLALLLPERVGSQLSRTALREDLQVAHTTVNLWLKYLEAVYYFFEIRPYSKSIKKSLKREGRLYLWDYSEVPLEGAKFENLVAGHLLKLCHYWTDSGRGRFELRYLRDITGQEIDFLIVKDQRPWLPIEAKLSDQSLSPGWKTFLPQLNCKLGLQIVAESGVNRVASVDGTNTKVYIQSAASALSLIS